MNHDFRFWHFSEVACLTGDICSRTQSGSLPHHRHARVMTTTPASEAWRIAEHGTLAPASGFEVCLTYLQAVPAALCDALSDRPRNDFDVVGRELVERLPRTRNLASACQVTITSNRKRRFDRHFQTPQPQRDVNLHQLDRFRYAFDP
jgi:hypothetical protein